MKTSGLLFAVSAAASLTFLLARPLTPADWPVIFKVLSIFLLAVLGLLADLGTLLAGFGALLFIASDAMIAISKFGGSFLGNEQSSGSPTTQLSL
jgi:uncharacterized membrane protein YhhN